MSQARNRGSPSDTPEHVLQNMLRAAKVTQVFVEALKTGNEMADQNKRQMGKNKNHWVLRVLIETPFRYVKEGITKMCYSVRLSVEYPPGTLECRQVSAKAMPNSDAMTTSALVHFAFKVLKRDIYVSNLIDVASEILPFTYRIVATSFRGSGRNMEMLHHPNGCRDFTAQWFYRLHLCDYVAWEAFAARHVEGLNPIQDTEAFHHIIGYRYSRERIDPCPIAMAELPRGAIRHIQCTVTRRYGGLPGSQTSREVMSASEIFARCLKQASDFLQRLPLLWGQRTIWSKLTLVLGGSWLVHQLISSRRFNKREEMTVSSGAKMPDRNKIIEATTAEVLKAQKRPFHENIRGFRFVDPDSPDDTCYWVKFAPHSRLLRGEADTQAYVRAELAKMDHKTRQMIHVPEVFGFIEAEIDGLSYGMIVMEYVTTVPISRIVRDLRPAERVGDSLIATGNEEKVAAFKARAVEFICILLSICPPPDTSPGPVGGGRINHFVFGEEYCEAPQDFLNLEELEAYINQSSDECDADRPLVDFTTEGLKLCCCDSNLENFLLDDPEDPLSRMTVIDFEHVNWLPYSFLVWKLMYDDKRSLLEDILSHTQLELHEDNFYALDRFRIKTWHAEWISMPSA